MKIDSLLWYFQYYLVAVAVDTDNLQGKIVFGYQGWFQTNLCAQGWRHWAGDTQPNADSVTFDLWPAIDEFPVESLSDDTDLHDKTTGETLKLYDAAKVTDVHFGWMQSYGIHGVALQRFLTDDLTRMDEVMMAVKASAEKYQRAFFIEYDISGVNPDTWVDDLLSDWQHVNDMGVVVSPMYQKNEGKPVVKVYNSHLHLSPNSNPNPKLRFMEWGLLLSGALQINV